MAHAAEKSGNTSWVQCPACREWFPASSELLHAHGVQLHCPHCGRGFTRSDAARVVEAPGG
jgi:predicted Zn finger-like uncharacterized protein